MARRGERPPIGVSWIVTWPLSAVFAALVFLVADELRHPTREVAGIPLPPAVTGGAEWTARLPERIAAVDAALHGANLQLPKPVEEERGSGPLRWTHRRYDVRLAGAEQSRAEAAMDALRGVDPGVAVTAENTAGGTDVRIGLDGLLVSTVRFRWGEPTTPVPAHPRLAIVVGPLGDDLRRARQVVELGPPIAIAVRPFRPFSREVSELGRLFDRQVLVALDGADEGQLSGAAVSALAAALASVPQAVGVAWYPSGPGPPQPQLLAAIAQRQLVFVGAPGPAPARGVPPPVVASFGSGTPEEVTAELDAALDRARERGAIAIGEPTDAAVAVLAERLPAWRAADVELVPVTALAAPGALSAR